MKPISLTYPPIYNSLAGLTGFLAVRGTGQIHRKKWFNDQQQNQNLTLGRGRHVTARKKTVGEVKHFAAPWFLDFEAHGATGYYPLCVASLLPFDDG